MAVSSSIFYTSNISSSTLVVSGGYSIDTNIGALSSGSDISFEWGTRNVYDSNKISSINWENRTLIDSSVLASIDWENKFLNDKNNVLSIDWSYRNLRDINSDIVLTYSYINSSDGVRLYGTSSYTLTSSNTPNSLITASVTLNTITFTKGDGSTFPITVNTGSGGGTTTPGDGNQAIQFNSASVFSGSTNLKFDYVNNNIILTGSLLVTQSHISTVDYIDFTTVDGYPHNEGRLHWTNDTKTLQIDTDKNGFSIEVGHQNVVRVYNDTGADIPLGKVVRISGSQGNQPTIVTSSWNDDQSSATTLGFTATLISGSGGNRHGYVVTNGLLRNVNTVAYPVGTQLYLSSSGNFTSTPPDAPLHEVRLGKVIVQNATTGIIYVDVMNGFELTELHDVKTTAYSNGDLLIQSESLWINSKTLTGSYSLSGSLTTNDGVSVVSLTASFVSASSITGSLFGTSSWATNALTASFINPLNQNVVITGSFTIFTGSAVEFQVTNTGVSIGNQLTDIHSITGSLRVSGSITGSLFGTSSWATNSITASFLPVGTYSITSSWAVSASQAITASYITGSIFTSTNPALTSSFTVTASFALNSNTFATSIGNGSATNIVVTHNLGTRDVIAQVYDNNTYETVLCDIVRATTNAVTCSFIVAPTTNQYRVVIKS